MIKSLRLSIGVVTICFFVLSLYGNEKFEVMDFNEADEDILYFTLEEEEEYVSYFPDIKGLFLEDNEIKNLSDLIENSPLVLRVKTSDKVLTKGNGILNKCTVIDTIKGNYHNDENSILIYDNVLFWQQDSVLYFNGSKPLALEKEYIVFLKEAPNPNVPYSYVFSSVNFGSFELVSNSEIISNFENGQLTVAEARKYSYISNTNNHVDTYLLIQDQVIQEFSQ